MDWEAFSVKDWWGGSPLEDYVARAESATDDYTLAVYALSEARATFQRTYYQALAFASGEKSDAARRSRAEAQSVEEKIAYESANDEATRTKEVLKTRLAVMSTAQSHARVVDRQT